MTPAGDEERAQEFEELLEYLWRSRGFDFSAYKRSSLGRRVQKRMQASGIENYLGYSDYLEAHPQEFTLLFNTILINVTSFFRDPQTWEFMASDVIPRILADRNGDGAIRVWSAGCSSGEEPYSLSIALHNAGLALAGITWEIDACDLNAERVARAQEALYAEGSLRACDPEARRKYFVAEAGGFRLREKYRAGVRVFHTNLMAPNGVLGWSVYDAILCRNLLIYLSEDAFTSAISLFARSLLPGGYLFLGHSESLLDRKTAFAPAMVGGAVVYRKLEAA